MKFWKEMLLIIAILGYITAIIVYYNVHSTPQLNNTATQFKRACEKYNGVYSYKLYTMYDAGTQPTNHVSNCFNLTIDCVSIEGQIIDNEFSSICNSTGGYPVCASDYTSCIHQV